LCFGVCRLVLWAVCVAVCVCAWGLVVVLIVVCLLLFPKGDPRSNAHVLQAAASLKLPVAILTARPPPQPHGLVALQRIVPPPSTPLLPLLPPPLPPRVPRDSSSERTSSPPDDAAWPWTQRHEASQPHARTLPVYLALQKSRPAPVSL